MFLVIFFSSFVFGVYISSARYLHEFLYSCLFFSLSYMYLCLKNVYLDYFKRDEQNSSIALQPISCSKDLKCRTSTDTSLLESGNYLIWLNQINQLSIRSRLPVRVTWLQPTDYIQCFIYHTGRSLNRVSSQEYIHSLSLPRHRWTTMTPDIPVFFSSDICFSLYLELLVEKGK